MKFRLIIQNVNDAPIITSILPESGSKFTKGVTITFQCSAQDEDQDNITYTWKEGATVLGTGAEFPYNELSSGAHTITLVVDDGTNSTSQDILITVTEKDEGPALSVAGVILAFGIVTLIQAMGHRRRTKG